MPEGIRRVLALLVAVLLVVAALLWRANRDDDSTAPTTVPGVASVICATELESVCRSVFTTGLTIEPAGTTAHTLETASTPPDLWLTLDPWPSVVAERRARASRTTLAVQTAAVASTRAALVGPKDRLDVMKAHCAAMKVWACIGDMSGQPWSSFGGLPTWQVVKPAYFRPDLSASGYTVFANAVVAELGFTMFSNLDLDGIKKWGHNLEDGVPTIEPTDPPPLEQLQLGVPRYDLIGVLETEIPQPLKPGLDVLYPEPMANVAVIAMTGPGFSVPSTLATSLKQAGWTDPPVAASGLPEPTSLADAVLAFWNEVKGR
jgi:hypothetical protein